MKAEVRSARPAYDICDNSGDGLNFVPPKIQDSVVGSLSSDRKELKIHCIEGDGKHSPPSKITTVSIQSEALLARE